MVGNNIGPLFISLCCVVLALLFIYLVELIEIIYEVES